MDNFDAKTILLVLQLNLTMVQAGNSINNGQAQAAAALGLAGRTEKSFF